MNEDGPYRTPGEVEIEKAFKMKTDYGDIAAEYIAKFFFSLIGIGLALTVLYPLSQWVLSSGKADYCYVVQETSGNFYNGKYQLMQHIPWHQDRTLASG